MSINVFCITCLCVCVLMYLCIDRYLSPLLKIYCQFPVHVNHRKEWGSDQLGGAASIMTEEEVKQKRNDHWQKTGGLAFTRKDVKSWLIDHRNAQIVAMGGVPDPTWEPPASTVGNYYHLFTTDEEVALTQRAQGQTNTRFAASNSEKAAVCLSDCWGGVWKISYRRTSGESSHAKESWYSGRSRAGGSGEQILRRRASIHNPSCQR